MVKLLDCTTRDGGHNTNWEFENKFITDLMKFQNDFGISYYEIGYRNHFDTENKGKFYNCTPDILEYFYKIKGNIQLGVMTDTKRFSYEDFTNAENDFVDFIRIATHPNKINQTLKIADELYNRGYKIFIQLMDVSNIDEKGYLALYQWENKNILESLYFADSYGTLYPEDIKKYYTKLKTLGYEKISFHAHNNIQMALQNTLQAIELGAYSIDVSKDGMGRCGGNLNVYDLLNTLQTT